MKRNIGRFFPLVLALLVSHVACYQQYSYSFYYNESINNPTSNNNYLPTYSLGTLSVGYSIRIIFSIPKAGSLSGSQLDNALSAIPQRVALYYLNPATGLPVLAQTSTGSFGFPKIAGNSGTYQTNYEVYFTDSTMQYAEYKLVIKGDLALASNKLTYFTINVNLLKSKTLSVGDDTPTLLKIAEVFRDKITKFFYVGPNSNPTTMFTAYPVTSDGPNVINPFKFTVNRLSSPTDPLVEGNNWQMDQVDILGQTMEEDTNSASPVFMNQVGHYELSLPKGFYVLIVSIDPQVLNHFSARISFESDTYRCPYNPDFTDYYQNFQGCSMQSSQDSGPPCLSFNSILGQCTLCMDGYILQGGSCLANTTCPDRKYYSFGQCQDVDPLCDGYDKFTGVCLSCKDTLNYLFVNGRCIYQEIYCGTRQYKINRQCFDVSATCGNFNSTSGRCIDCINNLYQLSPDGACTAITKKCPPNTFLFQFQCYPIPPECADFDISRGLCNKCIRGYSSNSGFCKRIVCSEGQVPSRYDESCQNVSPLCKDYDNLTGDCLSCKNNLYTVRDGQCLQVVSTLAGCMERQKLGFGECVGAEYYCKIFDLVSLNCNQCYDGYYLDYTGKCSKQPQCGPGKWTVNGQCLSYPHNCIKVDKIGLCIQCESEDYRLQFGQCVYFKKCQDRQYLTPQGQCKAVSPFCATWHPSNGLCITCQIQDTKPNQGVCCQKGTIFRGTSCMVPEAPYQFNSSQKCFIRHPSLGYCLRCADGYEPDYGTPYACKQK